MKNSTVARVSASDKCKLISCILPNDGTDKKLMLALRDEKNIIRANKVSCLGMAILGNTATKFGQLPEPSLVWKIDVLVAEAEADDLYDYIYEKACVGRPQGGAIWMGALTLTSLLSLPKDVPLEPL